MIQANPNGSGIYVEQDTQVLVSGGRIGFPVKQPVEYTNPERQRRKLENLHP
jgi:hypothetical protein